SDTPPWPPEAAGLGSSLQRVRLTGYGNDPSNWCASPGPPSPGRENEPTGAPPPQIESVDYMPGLPGVLRFSFMPQLGTTYVIEWTEDLQSMRWHILTTITPQGTICPVNVSDAVQPSTRCRYYRIRTN
ncbi:MAG: hypothetical protein N3G20_10440, partial [Verrucomicrobiae bacterium]|nr:hypothetical protein [Verrucomicrobiae bacterium]